MERLPPIGFKIDQNDTGNGKRSTEQVAYVGCFRGDAEATPSRSVYGEEIGRPGLRRNALVRRLQVVVADLAAKQPKT